MQKSKCLPWDEVERTINKEKEWLKKSIETSPFPDKEFPVSCPDCIYRRIAVLIVSGKIKVKEIDSKKLWSDMESSIIKEKNKKHGGEWHNNTIKVISKYFKNQNYKIESEPRLNYGNADLLVYKNGEKNIYVEVGSVSLYKLLYNLETMKDVDLMIVPKDNYLIEFNI